MDASVLNDAERARLTALAELEVRYLVIGMSAALLQGARGATEDIDLWFERLDDPRLAEAAHRAGSLWMSGTFGMRPPGFAGEALGDRFDVVMYCHGLGAFEDEYAHAVPAEIDGVPLRLLPLDRILTSKRAARRPKETWRRSLLSKKRSRSRNP